MLYVTTGTRDAILVITNVSSVNCGLYPFLNGTLALAILTTSPTLNFGLRSLAGFLEEYNISNTSSLSTSFKSIGVGGFLDTDLGRSISKVVEISLG